MPILHAVPTPNPSHAALFDAMVDGYQTHRDARNVKFSVNDADASTLRRLRRELDLWPWDWRPAEWEKYQSQRMRQGRALSTRRSEQNVLDSFLRYLNSPDYGWSEKVFATVGQTLPCAVITEANRILHIEAKESRSNVRAATRDELQTFFDFLDDVIDDLAQSARKGAVQAYRDATFIKSTYGFGWRRREGSLIEDFDFAPNIDMPAYGELGAVRIRHGKAKPFGPERERTVFTVETMDWIVPELRRYLDEVRPLFRRARSKYVFVGERGAPLNPGYVSQRFARWRNAAGLDPMLTLHSLRRSYISHLLEHGWAGRMVSEQVGHELESSTALYTEIGDDARHTELLRMQRQVMSCNSVFAP
jgi:site-specific recombinase XerD